MRPLANQVLILLIFGQAIIFTTSLGSTAKVRKCNRLLAYLGEGEEGVFIDRLSKNGQAQEKEPTGKKYFEGAGTLGDIMSDGSSILQESCNRPEAGLVTRDGGTLAARFGIESKFDRMALTANGNLQRLFSSYYDAPVHVVVDSCEQRTQTVWYRTVHLTVFDQVFCTAQSVVTLHDPECISLVQSGQVGLGQLFRHLDRLPTFELLDAGYTESGALWRLYELNCKELSCNIREDFHQKAWELSR